MHKDFYIFRHGETDYNLQQRWQGQGIDISLNETGKAQAKVLADKLLDKKLEIICSSPLKRALQTAQIVAKQAKIPVKIEQKLVEGNVGVCEGMLRSDVEKKYPQTWAVWYGDNNDMDVRWENGESKREIANRMQEAFDEMLALSENTIGVASHGAAIRYFLLQFGYGPHKMANTALFHLVYDDGVWNLKEANL